MQLVIKMSKNKLPAVPVEFDVIIPTEAELASSEVLTCPQHGCKSRFSAASNLTMHLVKHHKLLASLPKQCASYACPVINCKRNIHASTYFKSFKLLKQHYLKCHSAKTFKCPQCPKAFAKEYMQRAHIKSCGKKFTCSCGWEYNSREALLTHCKRKSHMASSLKTNSRIVSCEEFDDMDDNEKMLQVCITSKSSKSGHPNEQTVVAAIALSELATTLIIPKNCHTSVQTSSNTVKIFKSSKNSRETQTGKKPKKSTETQTTTVNRKSCQKCKVKRKRRRSTETQTKDMLMPFMVDASKGEESLDLLSDSSQDVTLRKSPSLNDYRVWDNPDGVTSKSYTSDNESNVNALNSFEKLCNNETQTDLDVLFDTETEGMSSAETQTTDDLIEDLYSHMCTQTTDLFDFNWVDTSDNQTQTAWPDM